jgi:hypothetical protein
MLRIASELGVKPRSNFLPLNWLGSENVESGVTQRSPLTERTATWGSPEMGSNT